MIYMLEWVKSLDTGWKIVFWIAFAAAVAAACWGCAALNRMLFKRLEKRHRGIHLAFFEKISSAVVVLVVIILAATVFGGARSVWTTVFGGTAIVSAVLVFAAQDTIKDILAGLMISVYKPFEIGDRIVLDDGTAGIVENITLRHVVLVGIDSMHIIIPNSKLNGMQISNFSYESELLSIQFRFSVSYDSDLEKVKKVIARAVEESEYSLPARPFADGSADYGPVYFLSFSESALVMAVTVFFDKRNDPETVVNDVNTRVRGALVAAGVEIPYNYVNVVNVQR